MNFRGMFVAGATALIGLSTAASAEDTVRYATDGYGLGALVIIAAEKGYLAEEDIKPVVQYFAAGVDTVDSVLAGQADFGVIMDVPLLTRFASGKLISPAVIGVPVPGWHKLFVSADMKAPADYKGKKYGVVAGTAQEFITRQHLRQMGVNPETEADLVSFGAVFDIVGAMKAGRIDGGWIWGEGVEVMDADSSYQFVGDDSVVEQTSSALLVTSREFDENNRDIVERTLRALQKSADMIDDDLAGAAAVVAGATGGDEKLIENAIRDTQYAINFANGPVSSLKDKYDFFVDAGVIETPYDFAKQFDTMSISSAIPGAEIDPLVKE